MLWSHTGVLSILEASLIGLLEEEDRQKGSLCPTRNAHIPRLLRLSASLPSFCLPTCVLLFLDSDLVQDLFPGPAAASTYHQPPPFPRAPPCSQTYSFVTISLQDMIAQQFLCLPLTFLVPHVLYQLFLGLSSFLHT